MSLLFYISSLCSNAICLLAQKRYIVTMLRCDMFACANAIYCRFAPMRYVCLCKRDILSLCSNAICLLVQTRYIVASLQCDINPSRPAGHIVRRSLISLPEGISQGVALYRSRREYAACLPRTSISVLFAWSLLTEYGCDDTYCEENAEIQ